MRGVLIWKWVWKPSYEGDHPAPGVISYSGYVSDQVRMGTTSVSLYIVPLSTGDCSFAGVFFQPLWVQCVHGCQCAVDYVLRI